MQISLDGYFMRSELELALQLVRRESTKLVKGFKVKLNISRLENEEVSLLLKLRKIKRLLLLMGAGMVRVTRENHSSESVFSQNVGFYAHENAWFL